MNAVKVVHYSTTRRPEKSSADPFNSTANSSRIVDMASTMRQRIKAARLHAGLTQEQLGELCGVSKSAVSNWETSNQGKHANPTYENMKCLANATGAPIEWLLDDTVDLDHNWQRLVKQSDIVAFPSAAPPPQQNASTQEEQALLDKYRLLKEEHKAELMSALDRYFNAAKEEMLKDPRIRAFLATHK